VQKEAHYLHREGSDRPALERLEDEDVANFRISPHLRPGAWFLCRQKKISNEKKGPEIFFSSSQKT
jgi:hypothetical protein